MNTIKFSHDYGKLPNNWEGTEAQLIAVIPIASGTLKNIMPMFYVYDTKFRGEDGCYHLNFDYGIILLLLHVKTKTLFTTIRRDTNDKRAFYSNKTGQLFVLERVEG